MRDETKWALFAVFTGVAMMAAPLKYPHMPPFVVDALFFGGTLTAAAFFAFAAGPYGLREIRDLKAHFKLKRVKDWTPYDQIAAFRLGQWAALIDEYIPHPNNMDDPAYRPWQHTFFRMKWDIHAGKFRIGATHANRHTLVSRDAIRQYFIEAQEYPKVLFPEQR